MAALPPRNELLGQLLSTVQAPAQNLLRALTGLMSDLVSVLDQIAERGGAAAPATPAAETEESATAKESTESAPAAEGAAANEGGEGATSAPDEGKPEEGGKPAGEESSGPTA
jgi:hypothetical protein